MGYSTSQMLFGCDLWLPADPLLSRPPDAALASEEYFEKLHAWIEEMSYLARNRIGVTSEKMKTRCDEQDTTFKKATKRGCGIRNVAKDSIKNCRLNRKVLTQS
ncbi:hypothetical protein TNCV_2370851 [Trichonephila clavipes]|nr:hypothetical protein TNCV_2370851 [Trichonephila clavipes]